MADLEKITEKEGFDPIATGYKKYLDKWAKETLITLKESTAGKTP